MRRRLLKGLLAVPLALSCSAAAAWQAVSSSKGYVMERIEFAKGSQPGQIHYDRTPVSEVVPKVLSIGPAGEIYVVEPRLNRLQVFSPEGRFVHALALGEVATRLRGGINKAPSAFVNVFPVSAYRAAVLARVRAAARGPHTYALFSLNAETGTLDRYVELRQPPTPQKVIEMSFLDRNGFLWLFTDRWTVFAAGGDPAGSVGELGNFVDARGLLFIPGEVIRIVDRNGNPGNVKPVPPGPTQIDGGEAEGLLFAWERHDTARRIGNVDEYANVLALYRLDAQARELRRTRRVELPPTRLSYPGPNPDVSVPIQSYVRELGTLRGRYFYILAHSKDKYWIDRVDLTQ